MPAKKKKTAAPTRIPTKESFFQPARQFQDVVAAAPVKSFKPPVVNPRPPRLLYNEGTGQAYAEVVGNAAICLDSGQELFRFKNGDDDDECNGTQNTMPKLGFDFTAPVGTRHPNERSVDIAGLMEFGILSEQDVENRRGFTDEQLREMMEKLAAYRGGRA